MTARSYEDGYRAGGAGEYADWEAALADVLPDGVECYPQAVAAYIDKGYPEGQYVDAVRAVAENYCSRATGPWPCAECLRTVGAVLAAAERADYRVVPPRHPPAEEAP